MMDNIQLKRLSSPIVTGTAGFPSVKQQEGQPPTTSFATVLNEKIQGDLRFSNHAANRVQEREISLSTSEMDRLNQGVSLAKEKGLNQTLILIDQTAFVVSAKHNKVITTLGGNDLKSNVFTNIEGTVII